jgi:hypothetical protein
MKFIEMQRIPNSISMVDPSIPIPALYNISLTITNLAKILTYLSVASPAIFISILKGIAPTPAGMWTEL